ncbi:hypothetical protein [Yinghuangia sp. YIM S09857]|uniref:hypothetical protein n=1 Tax=Yinghuangia sp. YIM S09857 TaxID=3436929 RepID=UPI003F53DB95
MRRKHLFTTVLYAVLLGTSVSACASGDKASKGGGDAASPANPTPPGATGASNAPGGEAPATDGGTAAANDRPGMSALVAEVAAARSQVGRQQTYKSKAVQEYDGELASVMQQQVRVSDSAQRIVTTTYPAAFAAVGAPHITQEQTSESLMIGNTVYSKLDPNVPGFSPDKSWSKATLPELTTSAPQGMGDPKAPRDEGPLAYLDKLINSGDIRVQGKEVVDGVQTTHYAGTISLVRLLEDAKLTDQMREQTRQIYEAMGMDRSTLDLWVGPDGLPVKQVSVMPMKLSKPILVKSTVTYSDWGRPVDLTPPPAGVTEDLGVFPPMPGGSTGPKGPGGPYGPSGSGGSNGWPPSGASAVPPSLKG